MDSNSRLHDTDGDELTAIEFPEGIDEVPEARSESKHLKFLGRKKSRSRWSDRDFLGFLAVGSLALHGFLALGLLLLWGAYSRLASKPPPALVQTESGQAFPVAAIGSRDRTPQTIKSFILDSLTLIFTWSGRLPAEPGTNSSPQLDKGVEVTGGKRVATSAAIGALVFEDGFRKEMLAQLAEMTPSGVFSGRTQVLFEPLAIEEPVRLGEGEWRVRIVANLVVATDTRTLQDSIPFNKDVFVRSVVPPRVWDSTSGVAREAASVRAAGLEITKMADFK